MYKVLILILWILFPTISSADDSLLSNVYINPVNQTHSEAIILYNSANPCENCDKAINMIVKTLKKNYNNILHAYLIDTNHHEEFISAFKIHGPLALVIIKISDKAAFGYNTLYGLQSMVNNKQEFSRRIIEFINNFLGIS